MEMESGGILEAVAGRHVQAVCIRGISDGADFNKRALEQGLKDENRRFALEAALAVLEATLLLKVEDDNSTQIAGVEFSKDKSQIAANGLGLADELFSLLGHIRHLEMSSSIP